MINKPTKYKINTGVLVEAMRLVDYNLNEVAEWCNGVVIEDPLTQRDYVSVPTPFRATRADINDWLVKNDSGSFLILNQHIFNTYMTVIEEI